MVRGILRTRECGFDTEFFGVDPRKRSTVGLATVHVFSVATVTPDGRAVHPAVLPAAALDHPAVREMLQDPGIIKAVHNQPVDDHALANRGVFLRGAVNTLGLGRWMLPDRHPGDGGAGWSLDALGKDLFDEGKTIDYEDLVTEIHEEIEYRIVRAVRCECLAIPCRRRSSTPGHNRGVQETTVSRPRMVKRIIPLDRIVPGHPRWPAFLAYSGRDAALALKILLTFQRMDEWRPLPW